MGLLLCLGAPPGANAGPPNDARSEAARGHRPRERTPEIHTLIGRRWMFLAPLSGSVGAGYADEWFQRESRGGFAQLGARVEPGLRYSRGRLRLRAPLSVAHRETTGEALRQSELSAGLAATWRPADAISLSADTTWERRWRPGWPDPYQPELGPGHRVTGLEDTDRGGRAGWLTGLELWWRPEAFSLGLRGDYEQRVGTADPAYDPVLGPTHLVPGDRDRWGLAVLGRGRLVDDVVRWRAALGLAFTRWPYALSRDEHTGLTHGLPGGQAANPPARSQRASAETEWSAAWRLLATRFRARVGLEHNEDPFQGYDTWSRVRVGAGATVRPWSRLRVSLDYDLRLRRYSEAGYAEGPEHPPLDDGGDLRADRSDTLAGEISWRFLRRRLVPFVGARLVRYETNFPDYVPFEFPRTAAYDIDWDVRRFEVMAGLRWRL